jgi:hypothetical protein
LINGDGSVTVFYWDEVISSIPVPPPPLLPAGIKVSTSADGLHFTSETVTSLSGASANCHPCADPAVYRLPDGRLRIYYDDFNSATGITTLSSATSVQKAPAPPLGLSLRVNQTSFAAGQTLVAGGGVENFGLPGTADFYVGILRPDNSIQFFTSTGIAFGNLSDLTSFRPFATGVPLATAFSVNQPTFYTHQWTAADLHGSWTFFLLALKAGALSDGMVTDSEFLGLATAPFSLP